MKTLINLDEISPRQARLLAIQLLDYLQNTDSLVVFNHQTAESAEIGPSDAPACENGGSVQINIGTPR